MPVSENERITQETFAAWNAHDPEAYAAHIADDYVWESESFPEPVRGKEAVKATMRANFAAFPDLHLEVETSVASDNHVAKTWMAPGTDKAEALAVDGEDKHMG